MTRATGRTARGRRAGFFLFLGIAIGCQSSENRYLARTVTSEELVGSWRATAFAIKSLRDVGVGEQLAGHGHTLVLRADGSCSIRTIMNMPVSGAADYRIYDTGCRWRLGRVGQQALQFDLTPMPPGGSPHYFFDEEDGRLLLWQYAVDPDSWRYMEFEKKLPEEGFSTVMAPLTAKRAVLSRPWLQLEGWLEGTQLHDRIPCPLEALDFSAAPGRGVVQPHLPHSILDFDL